MFATVVVASASMITIKLDRYPVNVKILKIYLKILSPDLFLKIVKRIYEYFKEDPFGFQYCAAKIAGLMDRNVIKQNIRFLLPPIANPFKFTPKRVSTRNMYISDNNTIAIPNTPNLPKSGRNDPFNKPFPSLPKTAKALERLSARKNTKENTTSHLANPCM